MTEAKKNAERKTASSEANKSVLSEHKKKIIHSSNVMKMTLIAGSLFLFIVFDVLYLHFFLSIYPYTHPSHHVEYFTGVDSECQQ